MEACQISPKDGRCDAMWRRWTPEYMRALQERRRLKHDSLPVNSLSVGDVVILKSEERNRNFWPLGTVQEVIEGHDCVVRAAKVLTRKTVLEPAIQHLFQFPMPMSCVTLPNKANTGRGSCSEIAHSRHRTR